MLLRTSRSTLWPHHLSIQWKLHAACVLLRRLRRKQPAPRRRRRPARRWTMTRRACRPPYARRWPPQRRSGSAARAIVITKPVANSSVKGYPAALQVPEASTCAPRRPLPLHRATPPRAVPARTVCLGHPRMQAWVHEAPLAARVQAGQARPGSYLVAADASQTALWLLVSHDDDGVWCGLLCTMTSHDVAERLGCIRGGVVGCG